MVVIRPARRDDARAIADIYNEGMDERQATLETRHRSGDEVALGVGSPSHPLLVAERDGRVVGWARLTPYSDRPVYSGIAECSVYVTAEARGRGIGARLTEAIAVEAGDLGLHKLLGKLLTSNAASVRLVHRCGFREVGVHLRHGRLDGRWRDVLLVERLL
jgi:L-amino acid N-acyltransferase YncA